MTKAQQFWCPRKRQSHQYHKSFHQLQSHKSHSPLPHSHSFLDNLEVLKEDDARCNNEFLSPHSSSSSSSSSSFSSFSSTSSSAPKKHKKRTKASEKFYKKVAYRYLNEPCIPKVTFPFPRFCVRCRMCLCVFMRAFFVFVFFCVNICLWV